MSHDGSRPRLLRSVAILTTGVLTVPALAGCGGSDHDSGTPAVAQDIAPAARGEIGSGGTVRWAVDDMPQTLNTFQADADNATARVAGAVLPSLFRLDERGRPQRNADYLKSAEVVDSKPKQVVLYKLNPKARWSDGRRISAADFIAQWHALSGRNTAFWTARNAGYDRIEKIVRGKSDREVRVTFSQPYADWRSLFAPLYPKQVMGSPDAFNDGARRKLKVTAGPFTLAGFDARHDEVTLRRNPNWWGDRAKLAAIVFKAVPRNERVAALTAGSIDVADVDTGDARRVTRAAGAHGAHGPGGSGSPSASAATSAAASTAASAHASASASGEHGSGDARHTTDGKGHPAAARDELRHYTVRKSFEPAYTQLALNGASGPLADERVRRAVARAIDREALARLVLKPLGLPVRTVGSHLALAGQDAYADGSGALGKHDTAEAQALLADAGWVRDGEVRGGAAGEHEKPARQDGRQDRQKEPAERGEKAAGEAHGQSAQDGKPASASAPERARAQAAARSAAWTDAVSVRDERLSRVRPAAGPDGHTEAAGQDGRRLPDRDGGAGAYAPKGTAAPARSDTVQLVKKGKPLTLRFVLPAGEGSEALRTVGRSIARTLARIGIRTVTTRVTDDSYFNDHIAAGQYDLALYSWPGSAFPATDARPIFAKPVPGADGSLNVEQNYSRVGTDHIDQLFDQALTELDDAKERELIRKADARIWAEAGSIPLYQRPQLVAVRASLANVGAFGFEDPRYEDIGFRKTGAKGPGASSARGSAAPGTQPPAESGKGRPGGQ